METKQNFLSANISINARLKYNYQSDFHLGVESNFTTLHDWIENLAPPYYPVRGTGKTKTNRDLLAGSRFPDVHRGSLVRLCPL